MERQRTEKVMTPPPDILSCDIHPARRRFLLVTGTAFLAAVFFRAGAAFADQDFRKWIDSFRKTALASGITAATYTRAFSRISSPDPEVLKKAAYQPEFTDPTWNYFDNRVNEKTVNLGRIHAKSLAKWLTAIEKRFGVNRNILLAIWSMESNYGEVLKRHDIMRDAISSLATLAYADPKRSRYGRTQLIAAMKILQRGDIDRSSLKGSWAGALGHTQFIPTSYLAYSVDMDGDGRNDIWNSIPDALASAANLLARNGWRSGRTWGYEIILPAGRQYPSGSLTIAEWQKLGVKRATNQPFPHKDESAVLKLPDGRKGPVFLVTKNFLTLKRYNNADRYALAVGLLADRIGGYHGLVRDWNRPFIPITAPECEELQSHLNALGYYHGEIDGKIGTESRKAIAKFQQKNGLDPDGHPSKDILLILRKR